MKYIGLKTDPPKSISLYEAIDKIIKGKWVLAPFQRPDVWSLNNQKALLKSLIEGIPIGMVILKKRTDNYSFRDIPGIIRPVNSNPEALIIDGQQRLSFLTWMLMRKDPDFKYGPKNKFHYNLLGDDIEDCIINDANTKENFQEGIIELNKYFDKKLNYHSTVSNKIIEHQLDGRNKNNLTPDQVNNNIASIFNESRIIYQMALETADEGFGFKLYSVVNKTGVKLKGIDYVEGALYQTWPELFEKMHDSINILKKVYHHKYSDDEYIPKDSFKAIFNRTNFTRCIIDELYHTPNPEDRENKNSELNKLMDFNNPTCVSGKLTAKKIENAFEKVRDAYSDIKNILLNDLNFSKTNGLNSTFFISANTLFREIGKNKITSNLKGKFIKHLILFHGINKGNPYLGGQDVKIQDDCNAARKIDFNLLFANLAKNLKCNTSELKFNLNSFLLFDEKNKIDYSNMTSKTRDFQVAINRFFAQMSNAKDWLSTDNFLANTKTGHIDVHHIFPKLNWGTKMSPEEKIKMNHPANMAHIHYSTNRNPILKKNPDIYFKDIIDLDRKEQLIKQQIPVEDKSLWIFKNYDAFIKKRSENIVKYANECLIKLEKSDWEEGIMDDDIDIIFLKNIQSQGKIENEITEYKHRFLMFCDQINHDYACVAFKEICAFLNHNGGTLWIGINDDGEIKGIDDELEKLGENLKTNTKFNQKGDFFDKFWDKVWSYFDKNTRYNVFGDWVEFEGKTLFKIVVRETLNKDVLLKKFYKFDKTTGERIPNWKKANVKVVRNGSSSVFVDDD